MPALTPPGSTSTSYSMNKNRYSALAALVAMTTAAPFQSSHAQGNASGGVPLVKQGLSPHFMAVASKLEMGGAGFNYAEQADTLGLIADFIDGALKSLPEAERAKMPPD